MRESQPRGEGDDMTHMNRRHFLMSTAVMAGGAAVSGSGQPERHRPDGGRGLRRPRRQPRERPGRRSRTSRSSPCATSMRRTSPTKLKTLESKGPEEAGDLRRHAQDARRQDHRRGVDRLAEPLAHAADDLGVPGRQGRLRREAVLAQRLRIAADRRRRAQVRPHRPAGQPEPIVTRAAGRRSSG